MDKNVSGADRQPENSLSSSFRGLFFPNEEELEHPEQAAEIGWNSGKGLEFCSRIS